MAINVADLFLTLRASQEALLPDLANARRNVAAAGEVMAGLVRDSFAKSLGEVGQLFAAIPGGLGAPLAALTSFAGTAVGVAAQTALRVAGAVGGAAEAVLGSTLKGIGSAALGVTQLTVTALRATFSALPALIGGTLRAVPALVGGIARGVVGGVAGAVNLIAGVGGILASGFTLGFDVAWKGVKYLTGGIVGLVAGVASGVGSLVSGIAGAVAGIFGAVVTGGATLLTSITGIFSALSGIVSGVLGGVTGVFTAAVRGAADLLNALMTVAAGAAEKAVTLLARTVGAVLAPALSALSADLTDWGAWTNKAMEAEGVMARMGALLRGSGEAAGWSAGQLDVMAKSLEQLGGHSLEAIKQAQLTLLRFGEVRGFQFSGALAGARQLAAVLGESLPAAAQMLGRALESPERAARMLRQAGLNLTPLESQQLKAAMATGQLTVAQDILLGKLARLGDVAGAQADTLAGRVNYLKLTWESVGRAIGEALLPWATIVVDLLQPAVEGFAAVLTGALGGAAESGKSLLEQVRGWIAENKDLLMDWGARAAQIVLSAVQGIRAGFAWLGAQAVKVLTAMGLAGEGSGGGLKAAFGNALATVRAWMENIPLVWDVAMAGIRLGWATAMGYLNRTWAQFSDKVQSAIVLMGLRLQLALAEANPLAGFGNRVAQLKEEIADRLAADEAVAKAWEKQSKQSPFLKPDRDAIAAMQTAFDKLKAELAEKVKVGVDTADAQKGLAAMGDKIKRAKQALALEALVPTPTPVQNMVIKYSFVGAAEYGKDLQKSITGSAVQDEKSDRKAMVKELQEGNKVSREQLEENKKLNDLVKALPFGFGFGE